MRTLLIPLTVSDDVAEQRGKEIIERAMRDWMLYGEVHLTNADGITMLDPKKVMYTGSSPADFQRMYMGHDFPRVKKAKSLVGTVIGGWKCVSDRPYQGLDDNGRFWCRVLEFNDSEGYRVTVYGPDVGHEIPDYYLDRRDVLQVARDKLTEEPAHAGWSGEPHPGRSF